MTNAAQQHRQRRNGPGRHLHVLRRRLAYAERQVNAAGLDARTHRFLRAETSALRWALDQLANVKGN